MAQTIQPAMEDPTARQNRQYLDAVLRQMKQWDILAPGTPLGATRSFSSLLSPGQWVSVIAPSAVISVSGMGPGTRIQSLVHTDSSVLSYESLSIGNLQLGPLARVIFRNCTIHGTVAIDAGGQVAFTGVDFAGPQSFVNNAGLAADVTVTGTIKRNANAHVNATVINELVV